MARVATHRKALEILLDELQLDGTDEVRLLSGRRRHLEGQEVL